MEAPAGRGSTLTAATAASNLTLLISLVWALAHTFILLTPVVYCLLYTWGLQTYGPARSVVNTGPASTRWGLAVWAVLAGLVALLACLATAALCLAFGSGFTPHGVRLSLKAGRAAALGRALSLRWLRAGCPLQMCRSPQLLHGAAACQHDGC